MPETRVISLKGRIAEFGPKLEHAPAGLLYVGRVSKRGKNNGGWNLEQSEFANLHSVKQYGLAESLARFVQDVIDRPGLVEAIREHRGGIFACWCGDDPGVNACHAAILAYVADCGDPRHLVPRALGPRHDFGEQSIHRNCAEPLMPVWPPTDIVVPAGDWAGAL